MDRSAEPLNVLVLTDDGPTSVDLRIRIPFDALRRARAVGSYAVVGPNGLIELVGPTIQRIDVAWVKRPAIGQLDFILSTLPGHFVFDIDDNLLASPAYRAPWRHDWLDAVGRLLIEAGLITCTSPRLLGSLEARSGAALAGKTLIAPNLTDMVTPRRFTGRPEALVLASSDALPLTESRDAFLRGVEAFCLRHGTPLVYIGADPGALAGLSCDVRSTGWLSYEDYRGVLRARNLLAVAPLEQHGDDDTLDFIDGKSDLKLVEYGAAGVPGVYSEAPPYAQSPLFAPALVDCGDEAALLDALERVAADADRLSKRAAKSVADTRLADRVVMTGWGEALTRARLDHPLRLDSALEDMQRFGRVGRDKVYI